MNARVSLRSPFSPYAFVVGLLLTIASFVWVLSRSDRFTITSDSRPASFPSRHAEELRFVTTAIRGPAQTSSASRVEHAVPQRKNDSTQTQAVADVVVAPSAPVEQATPATAALAPQASRLTLPSLSWRNPDVSLPYVREPTGPRPPLTAAERDSVARAFARMAAARVPGREEKDSVVRGMSSPGTIPGRRVGEQGGAGGGAGGTIDVGFLPFGFGPSRAQRKRDSIADAENLERLARLRARVQAKRDSAPNW